MTAPAEASTVSRLQRSGVVAVERGLCLACRECEVACSLYHEGQCSPGLSRIHVTFDDFVPGLPDLIVCKQCDWPACYDACAARWEEPAARIDPDSGARHIDAELCHGCGDCLRACPLTPERTVIGVKRVGRKRVYYMCDLCHDRPEGPVCVQVCPGEALRFVSAEERHK